MLDLADTDQDTNGAACMSGGDTNVLDRSSSDAGHIAMKLQPFDHAVIVNADPLFPALDQSRSAFDASIT